MMPRLARLAVFVALAGAVAWALGHWQGFDPAALEGQVRSYGPLAPAVFMVAYATATVLFLPGSVFALAGGALFGPLWGTVYNLTAATIGATLAFAVARYLASDWVARRTGGRLKQVIEGVEAEGWRFVAFTRLVPLFPFNLLNYALGLTRIKLSHYVVTSLICMIPGGFAYTYLGYAGREAAAGSGGYIEQGLLALGLLAAVIFLPRLIRRLRKSAIGWIEPDALRRQIDGAGGATVIDVRGPDEFAGPLGHIGGALNLPVGELPDRLIQINSLRDKPVILVCRTDKRSAKAAEVLRDAGFRRVAVLRGGMEDWNRVGHPTERSGDLERRHALTAKGTASNG